MYWESTYRFYTVGWHRHLLRPTASTVYTHTNIYAVGISGVKLFATQKYTAPGVIHSAIICDVRVMSGVK